MNVNSISLTISLTTLKRRLRRLGLKRKFIVESDIEDIIEGIVEELYSCGYNLGYKALWKKLQRFYRLQVKRDTVHRLLQIADPEGIASRVGNRLHRRLYLSPGPNFLWHIDGYDKIKQFGFAIHGCIDGYLRKLIWLSVATTNNDPKVTAYYFLRAVQKYKLLPTIVRTDKGTENVWIESFQIAMRSRHTDPYAGNRSYVSGRSVRNQRIESYWAQLRKHSMDFYINFFKLMQNERLFDGSVRHIKCLQFAFGPLIESDLKKAKTLWNHHRIRKLAVRNNVVGKPNVLYYFPELRNAIDCKKEVNVSRVEELIDSFTVKPQLFDAAIGAAVYEVYPDITIPTSVKDALEIYKRILPLFDDAEE